METKEAKQQLRKQIREIKKQYDQTTKQRLSTPIFKQVEQLDLFQQSDCILLYWSMDDEVFTHDFINTWYKDKTILLPCIAGDDLILRQYQGTESMVAGDRFGIPEPIGTVFSDYTKIDLMIIPGVAFDKNKNRMGRGRGFYDRLLKSCQCPKLAVCFDFQLVENVPTEDFDVKMDMVISTSHIYK